VLIRNERLLPNPIGSKTFPASETQARIGSWMRFTAEYRDLAPRNDNNQSNSSNVSVPSPPPPPQLLSPSPNRFFHLHVPFDRTRFPSFCTNICKVLVSGLLLYYTNKVYKFDLLYLRKKSLL